MAGGRAGIRNGQRREEFLAKLEQGGDGCWEWWGYKRHDGYGEIKHNGKMLLVHRLAYELLIGEIPKGLVCDHLCRNPPCFNPQHIEIVTERENILRGTGMSARHAKKTHCPRGHEYAGNNLCIATNGQRVCRACHRVADSEYKARYRKNNPEKARAASRERQRAYRQRKREQYGNQHVISN